eukprot:1548282-Pyramimonas_sp.AAC.1
MSERGCGVALDGSVAVAIAIAASLRRLTAQRSRPDLGERGVLGVPSGGNKFKMLAGHLLVVNALQKQ